MDLKREKLIDIKLSLVYSDGVSNRRQLMSTIERIIRIILRAASILLGIISFLFLAIGIIVQNWAVALVALPFSTALFCIPALVKEIKLLVQGKEIPPDPPPDPLEPPPSWL